MLDRTIYRAYGSFNGAKNSHSISFRHLTFFSATLFASRPPHTYDGVMEFLRCTAPRPHTSSRGFLNPGGRAALTLICCCWSRRATCLQKWYKLRASGCRHHRRQQQSATQAVVAGVMQEKLIRHSMSLLSSSWQQFTIYRPLSKTLSHTPFPVELGWGGARYSA